MTTDSWKKRKQALEEDYFRKENERAIKRLKERHAEDKKRKSPVTGEEMEQITYHGVVIDRCPKSGGIWLEPGELEQIIKNSKEVDSEATWIEDFFKFISSGEK